MNISAKLDRSKIDQDQDYEGHLMVSIKAPESLQKRTPISLALVLDVSGSMSTSTDSGQSKLEAVKDVAAKVVRNLTADDELTLITFSTEVANVIVRQKVTNKDALVAQISNIGPQSSTNMSGGIAAGYAALVESSLVGMRRIMLLTDGHPNVGGDPNTILAYMSNVSSVNARNKSAAPVTLSAFGFGLDCDQEFLTSVAKLGGGNYTYIKGGSDISNLFARELGGLISCQAQNIKVKLNIKPENGEVVEVLNDVTVTTDAVNADEPTITASADDIYAGENKHIVAKIKLLKRENKPKDRAYNVCTVTVEYDDIKAAKHEKFTDNVKVEFVKADEADKDASLDVAEQVGLLLSAKAQIEAVKLANDFNFSGAQQAMGAHDVYLNALVARGSPLAGQVVNSMKSSKSNFSAELYDKSYGASLSGAARSATRYRGGAGGQCVGSLNESMETKCMSDMSKSFDSTAVPNKWEAGYAGPVFPAVQPAPTLQPVQLVVTVPPAPAKKSLNKSKKLKR